MLVLFTILCVATSALRSVDPAVDFEREYWDEEEEGLEKICCKQEGRGEGGRMGGSKLVQGKMQT